MYKSKSDVAQRMTFGILDQQSEQRMSARQLKRECAVRMRGSNGTNGVGQQGPQSVDFGENVSSVGDEGRVAPEATETSPVRRHQCADRVGGRHEMRGARANVTLHRAHDRAISARNS